VGTDYDKERRFFDDMAKQSVPRRMSSEVLERYARPKWPHLFGKEMMFTLAGDLKGKRVLEIGCGEGVASVQLAYCGALVDAIDISPISIEVARKRAELNGQSVNFIIGDFIKDNHIFRNAYDIVWCDMILHHLVDSLTTVIGAIYRSLRPDGLFIAREPISYAGWLRSVRSFVPVYTEATDDEQPLRESEFRIIYQRFPKLKKRYFRILARIDCLSGNLLLLRVLARLDNGILMLPGATSLAGDVVLWAHKLPENE
jgi:2-polyprenyl-3-methyl-5-hydroxy-6-metoxy-1,4-benzoquinol methylase